MAIPECLNRESSDLYRLDSGASRNAGEKAFIPRLVEKFAVVIIKAFIEWGFPPGPDHCPR
jgi:hypothetical protein